MTKKAKPRRSAARRQGGAGGYIVSVLVSAVVTVALIAVLVLVFQPDVFNGQAVAEAITPAPPGATAVAAVPDAPPARALVASGQAVNVRSGPGTGFDVVAALPPGTAVTIISPDASGGWYSVRLDDGREGWIAAELLTLDGAPAPPDVNITPSAPAETTPEPVACAPGEVQAWWNDTASLPYYQMVFALDQFPQAFAAEDYQRLYDMVRAARATFAESSHPACVEAQRAALLQTFDEVILAVREIANNNAESASNRAAAARTTFQTVLTTLETDYGTDVVLTNCGAEVWAAGTMPEMDSLFTILGAVNINTSAPDDVRRSLFDLQRFRRFIGKLAAPECVRVANDSLLGALDDFIAMYQAAISGDRTAAANANASATSQLNIFEAEMRKLGLG